MGPIHIPKFIAAAIRTLGSPCSLRLAIIGLSLLLGFVSMSPVSAATPVSGNISEDETWAVVDSPFQVTGNVAVASGVTLTIEPGVTVKFDSGLGLTIKGTLIARGTSTSTITFTSSAASPAAGDWVNILFHDDSQDAIFDGNGDYSSGSILEHCVVEYGGDSSQRMVYAASSEPFINYCTIRYSSGTGISASNNASLKILNSTITQNTGGGIRGSGDLTLSDDTISNNGYGIENHGGVTNISDSTIKDNTGIGLFLTSPNDTVTTAYITNNLIDNNGLGLRINGRDGSTHIVSGNTITNNDGTNSSAGENTGAGGGIAISAPYGASSVIVNNNQIRNNISKMGGGIWVSADGHIEITNNTIADNQATNTSGDKAGGGIYAYLTMRSSATSTISHNTITGNSAPSGGAAKLHLYTTGASTLSSTTP